MEKYAFYRQTSINSGNYAAFWYARFTQACRAVLPNQRFVIAPCTARTYPAKAPHGSMVTLYQGKYSVWNMRLPFPPSLTIRIINDVRPLMAVEIVSK